ncbi:MAG: GMC oxidoreductase [Candidatus Competibacteraceae bacterium]
MLLAAGALHSPRLLQDYLTQTGLAERLPNSRLVGRYYKHHLLTAVLAFSPGRKHDLLRKTLLLLNTHLPHSSVQPLGFDGELMATLLPRLTPRWLARALGERAYGFFLQTEDGSDERNRVIARANGASSPQLDYASTRLPTALTEHRQLVRALQRALLGAGCLAAANSVPLSGTAHACGTLVTGNDPSASVVDAYGRVHEMDNLYVVDGSVLPRSSRVNPSLTIYAWALRTATHLTAERLST